MSRAWPSSAWVTVLLVAMLGATEARAQDPLVRIHLKPGGQPDGSVWVGQPMGLVVELLAPGYFSGAPAFDLPDPTGVLLMPPQSHPVVGNETVDGVTYVTQRHELPAWAIRADARSIPSFTVRFRYKRHPLDESSASASLETGEVPITVRTPPGAEGLGTVISARNLQVQDQWDPSPGSDPVKAGAAFKRSIMFTAPGVPGMLFPPFPTADVDGLAIYARHSVEDRSDRGALTGKAVTAITYVLQEPGRHTVPAASFSWFDPGSGKVRTHTFPAQVFEVMANPDLASADAAGEGPPGQPASKPRAQPLQPTTWALLAAVLAALAVLSFSRRLRDRMTAFLSPWRPVHLAPLNPPDTRLRAS